MIISLGALLPARSGSLPGIQGRRAASRATVNTQSAFTTALFLLGLAPNGGYLAVVLLPAPVGSYPTVSPLPAKAGAFAEAVCFCGPIRQIAPPRVLPGILLFGVRTFLDPAFQPGRDHPTSLRNCIISLRDRLVKFSAKWTVTRSSKNGVFVYTIASDGQAGNDSRLMVIQRAAVGRNKRAYVGNASSILYCEEWYA